VLFDEMRGEQWMSFPLILATESAESPIVSLQFSQGDMDYMYTTKWVKPGWITAL